jgi:hypothetical protein
MKREMKRIATDKKGTTPEIQNEKTDQKKP